MAKTHIQKLRNPNFIGSWDLMDDNGIVKNRIFTIKDIKKESVHDGKGGQEDSTVLYCNELKPMILNSTNIKTLIKILDSPFIEDWTGKKIELTVKKIKAFGEVHDALRVVAAKVSNTPQKTINVPSILENLSKCKSIDELQTAWKKLSKEEGVIPEVIKLKEELKSKLS